MAHNNLFKNNYILVCTIQISEEDYIDFIWSKRV